jgi:hypothetical protein
MGWYRYHGESLFLDLHIQPRAKQNEFAGLYGERLRIRIKSPPVDGKANKMLLTFLADEFGTSISKIEIINGAQSRDKCVVLRSPRKKPGWFTALLNDETSISNE